MVNKNNGNPTCCLVCLEPIRSVVVFQANLCGGTIILNLDGTIKAWVKARWDISRLQYYGLLEMVIFRAACMIIRTLQAPIASRVVRVLHPLLISHRNDRLVAVYNRNCCLLWLLNTTRVISSLWRSLECLDNLAAVTFSSPIFCTSFVFLPSNPSIGIVLTHC